MVTLRLSIMFHLQLFLLVLNSTKGLLSFSNILFLTFGYYGSYPHIWFWQVRFGRLLDGDIRWIIVKRPIWIFFVLSLLDFGIHCLFHVPLILHVLQILYLLRINWRRLQVQCWALNFGASNVVLRNSSNKLFVRYNILGHIWLWKTIFLRLFTLNNFLSFPFIHLFLDNTFYVLIYIVTLVFWSIDFVR